MATTWVTISAADFITEGFNADERTKLDTAAGGDAGVATILSAAISEWRGMIDAAGYEVSVTAATVPPSCRRHVIAQARWQLLVKFPALRQLQTEERKAAADEAEKRLKDINDGKASIEDPTDDATDVPEGDWNSNVKIAMRLDTTRANV